MKAFLPAEYIEKYITNNRQEKTHMEVFFEFLNLQVFDNNALAVNDFALLNENDLIKSLEYYIERNNITSKQTASAYIGYLGNLFRNLENEYKIHNDVYVNGNFVPTFYVKAEKIILNLNSTVNTGTATDKDYKDLIKKIKLSEQKYSYEKAAIEIDSQIDKYVEKYEEYIQNHQNNKNVKKPNEPTILFGLILSICATRMVIEYGLKNSSITHIRISDIDMDKGTIKRGQYKLPISDELKNNLKEYLKIRQHLLTKLEKEQELLFVKCNGEPIDGVSAADKLFGRVMGDDSSKESTPYAKRCIERMVKEGFNLYTIREITGHSTSVYEQICDFINKENSIHQKIAEFVVPQSNEKTTKKHYINCPICNSEIKAISDNLVLVKKREDDILYLYCRECGEKEKAKAEGNINE